MSLFFKSELDVCPADDVLVQEPTQGASPSRNLKRRRSKVVVEHSTLRNAAQQDDAFVAAKQTQDEPRPTVHVSAKSGSSEDGSERYVTSVKSAQATERPAADSSALLVHIRHSSTKDTENKLRESLTCAANSIMKPAAAPHRKPRALRKLSLTTKFEIAKGFAKCGMTCPLILFNFSALLCTSQSISTASGYVISVQPALSRSHSQLLSRAMSPAWERHIACVATARAVTIFDVCQDGAFVGGVIVSRYWVRYEGDVVLPCMCIESIAMKQQNQGHGNKIFAWCKEVLFDKVGSNVRQGVIFAQCLDTPFWHYEMDITNVARALVFQMHVKFGDLYTPEPGCYMRAKLYQRSAAPS